MTLGSHVSCQILPQANGTLCWKVDKKWRLELDNSKQVFTCSERQRWGRQIIARMVSAVLSDAAVAAVHQGVLNLS